MNPGRGAPQSILSSAAASCMGLGFEVGCSLAFCVAFGVGCSAFAAVPFVPFAGSRSVLVLIPRLAVFSLVLNGCSRFELISTPPTPARRRLRAPLILVCAWCWFWPFAFGVDFWSRSAVSSYFPFFRRPILVRACRNFENPHGAISTFK